MTRRGRVCGMNMMTEDGIQHATIKELKGDNNTEE